MNGFDEEPNFEYVPVDASPASKARVRTGDRLYESMMLLAEGLETGAVTLQFDVSLTALTFPIPPHTFPCSHSFTHSP